MGVLSHFGKHDDPAEWVYYCIAGMHFLFGGALAAGRLHFGDQFSLTSDVTGQRAWLIGIILMFASVCMVVRYPPWRGLGLGIALMTMYLFASLFGWAMDEYGLDALAATAIFLGVGVLDAVLFAHKIVVWKRGGE